MTKHIQAMVYLVLAVVSIFAYCYLSFPSSSWACAITGLGFVLLGLGTIGGIYALALIRIKRQSGISYITLIRVIMEGKRPPVMPYIRRCEDPIFPKTSQGRDWYREFLDQGFTPSYTINCLSGRSLASYAIAMSHPTLPCVAFINELPSVTNQTSLSLATISRDGIHQRISNLHTGFGAVSIPIPGLQRHIVAGAGPRQLLQECAKLQSPGDLSPSQDDVVKIAVLTEYVLMRAWSQQGFEPNGAFEGIWPADDTDLIREARRNFFLSAWNNLAEFFLIKHNQAQGKSPKRPSPRLVARHLVARADQSASDFLDLLHDRLEVRGMADTSAKAQRKRQALEATQRSLTPEATGLDACDTLLKNHPDYGLNEVARFTHPVHAVLLKLS